MMFQWLGIAIILIGVIGFAVAFITREKSECIDPNLNDLKIKLDRLSKEQLESVRKKVESYVDE